MLEGESGTGAHLEVALLAPEAPDDTARVAVYLVDGAGLAGADQQVVVMIDVYGVQVEVIDARGLYVLPGLAVTLVETYVIETFPLKEHLSGLDVYLLNGALHRHALFRATDGGEVPWHPVIDRDQRRVLRADQELVLVPFVAVARLDPGYLMVSMVADHVLARSRFHPGKHGPTPVCLRLEIHGASMRFLQGTEPHYLPFVVDDQRAALPCIALLWGEEDVAGGGGARLLGDLDGGRAKVGARAEGPRATPRRGP